MPGYRLTSLSSAILMALGLTTQARSAVISVDNTVCTLDDALRAAEFDSVAGNCPAGNGDDVLLISEDLTVAGIRRVVSNVRIVGPAGTPPTISGDSMRRLFFIGDADNSAPMVSFENVVLSGGAATGGIGAHGGGGGAGMGGVVFIYDGNVLFDNARVTAGVAMGGAGSATAGNTAGGGGGGGLGAVGGNAGISSNGSFGLSPLFGNVGAGGGGGGGIFGFSGGTGGGEGGSGGGAGSPGGNGQFFGSAGGGGGGSAEGSAGGGGGNGAFGGAGGGGGGAAGIDTPGMGGTGGFGAGGGAAGSGEGAVSVGGTGGFGAGGGAGGTGAGLSGEGGGGGLHGGQGAAFGSGGGGAMGAGIFVRSGTVTILNSSIDFHQTTAGLGNEGGGSGQAKAAGLYVLNTLNNPNGNMQGMPAALPSVMGCGNVFFENGAANTALTDTDNPNTFGVSQVELSTPCDDLFADGFEDQP